jgi:hypothetical protein
MGFVIPFSSVNPKGFILVATGLFALCGAGFAWEWFMNHRKARFFVGLFGRTGARIFYALLGTGLVVLGTLITLGKLK